jgi:hypothetical protein
MYYHLTQKAERLSSYLQELAQQGVLQVPDPAHSAQAFVALLQGQIIERVRLGVDPAPTDTEIEQHIDRCVTLFLQAHQVEPS